VTFIAAFSNLETLSKWHGLGGLVAAIRQYKTLSDIVEGLLTSLALTLFLAIVPYLIRFIFRQRKFILKSQLDRATARMYWLFLFLNVFLGSVIAGSIWSLAGVIIDHPIAVVQKLASSLPSQALYLTNYILMQGYVAYSMFWLCRFDDLLICKFIQIFKATTETQKREAEIPVPFDYPILYARELLIFGIALTYSSMTPLVLPVATSYFAFAYLTMKYNFVFVFTPPYQGIGMTRIVIDRSVISIFLYQMTMIGVFALKLFPGGGAILILLITTAIFRWYIKNRYDKPSKYVPLNVASRHEASGLRNSGSDWNDETANHLFQHPGLIPPESSLIEVNVQATDFQEHGGPGPLVSLEETADEEYLQKHPLVTIVPEEQNEDMTNENEEMKEMPLVSFNHQQELK